MRNELSEQDKLIWDFLTDGYAGGRILAAECSEELLRRIHGLSPAPELVRWTREQQLEFCRHRWPDTDGSFRYILLGRLAERLEKIDLFKCLRAHLTYDGAVISLWGNVQHWSVVNDLLAGHWRFGDNPIFQEVSHRLFSQKEILQFFQAMKFRNLRGSYLACQGDEVRLRQLQTWSGVKNRLLLEVTFWCMEARLFSDEVIVLRGQMTPELRKELARMLRRVEHGIEPEVNCALVREVCMSQKLSQEYLEAFVRNVTLEPQRVLERLRETGHE